MCKWFNIIGLLLNMLGTLGIFYFGVPDKKLNAGVIHFEDYDDKKENRFRIYSKISLVIIFVGFLFQLIPFIKE